MATPSESKGRSRVSNLGAILDKKYEKRAKQLEMQKGKHLEPKEQIYMKTISDFRLLMAQSMPEADLIKEGQSRISLLKKDGKFDLLPADLKEDLSSFVGDENASDKEQDKRKGSSPVPSSQKNSEKGNQSVDAGPALKQSSYSPAPKHKTEIPVGPNFYQNAEEKQKLIKSLENQLDDERDKLDRQAHILQDREKHIKELESEIKTKDSRMKELEEKAAHLAKCAETEKMQCTKVSKDLEYRQTIIVQLEGRVNEYSSKELAYKKTFEQMKEDYKKLEKEKSQVDKARQREIEQLQDVMKDERRKFDAQYNKLLAERDDLRDRFSKLAGAKLQDKNADIADLSDPNRAMKLSERFGQIYDDEWTNAFESLTDKKNALPLKDAIALLLCFLQECWSFCNALMTTQMESLNSVFLHPAQNVTNFKQKQIVGGKDQPRIGSKDDKTLFALRRQIGVSPTVIEEVKQALLSESKTWNKEKGYEKKHVEACAPYLQKCAEICWLMALHDPPLYMKMDVKPGEKLNTNIYSVYSSSGNTIDFLVWPPLLNGTDGGLLAKGVAEPQRIVGKKN